MSIYGKKHFSSDEGPNRMVTPTLVQSLQGTHRKPIVIDASAGHSHSVAVKDSGDVYAWGYGYYGQLGHGDNYSYTQPKLLRSLSGKKTRHVACGKFHSAALNVSGEVFTWGLGDCGQLGHGNLHNHTLPHVVNYFKDEAIYIVEIACGDFHTMCLASNGDVYQFGRLLYPTFGRSTVSNQSLPQLVDSLSGLNVCRIASGSKHLIAITRKGEVFTWGWGTQGQLGHGESANSTFPRQVELDDRIVDAAGGGEHTVLVSEVGDIYTFGRLTNGRLGLSGTRTNHLPRKIVQVACGDCHTIALGSDFHVYAWGRGKYGRLGLGEPNTVSKPALISSLRGATVKKVACGSEHSIAIAESGDVFTWGWNSHGQLGLGEVGDCRNEPRAVSLLNPKPIIDYEWALEQEKQNKSKVKAGKKTATKDNRTRSPNTSPRPYRIEIEPSPPSPRPQHFSPSTQPPRTFERSRSRSPSWSRSSVAWSPVTERSRGFELGSSEDESVRRSPSPRGRSPLAQSAHPQERSLSNLQEELLRRGVDLSSADLANRDLDRAVMTLALDMVSRQAQDQAANRHQSTGSRVSEMRELRGVLQNLRDDLQGEVAVNGVAPMDSTDL